MRRAQENYHIAALAALVLVALIFAGKTAFSAGMADRGKPDPILNPQADGPCDPVLASPDLTPGTDVDGHQVASADLAAQPAFNGQVLVPLKPRPGYAGNSAYVVVDGRKLDPLLNPQPACH